MKHCCLLILLNALLLPIAFTSDPGIQANFKNIQLPQGFDQQSTRSNKLKLLFHEVDRLKNASPDLALQYAKAADSLANTWNRRFAKVQSAYYLAWLHHYAGGVSSFQPALTSAQICIQSLRSSDPPFWKAQAHALIAAILNGDRSSSQHLKLALELSTKIGLRTDSLRVTGMIHSIQAVQPGCSAMASSRYFQQAIADYTAAGEQVAAARAYKNLALHLFNQNDYSAANQAFERAISLFQKNKALGGWRDALVHQASFWMEKFISDDTVQTYFHHALANLNQARSLQPNLETYLQSGYVYHVYVALHDEHKPLIDTYLDSAQAFYLLALDQVSNSQDIESIRTLATNLDRLTAYAPLPKHSIQKLDQAYLKLLRLERRETAIAKAQISAFERARRTNQRWNYGISTSFAVVLVGFIFTYFQRKQEKKHAETQIKLWQTRLNPHFISNAINSIDSLLEFKKENRLVSRYLVKFNRFCRDVLDASDRLVVSLDQELKTLDLYMELEKLRLRERLSYHFEVDPQINPLTTQIPLLLLQPFLENAIWHGLHPQAQGGTVTVKIEKISSARIRITIEDDGVGLTASKTIQSENNRQHHSWGTNISNERLKSFNGKMHTPIKINEGLNGKGTKVEMELVIKKFIEEIA